LREQVKAMRRRDKPTNASKNRNVKVIDLAAAKGGQDLTPVKLDQVKSDQSLKTSSQAH
jgi:uncharacterized protein YnzC (UPF0291/DUF896 family)